MSILERALRLGEAKQFKAYSKRVERINSWEPELELLEDDELKRAVRRAARARDRRARTSDELLPEAFALTREVGRRQMAMRHFDVQLIGGMVLHDGQIAEMRTGEGKTLTGTLAVVLNALPAKGVHVVTVNDYLARRDADWMRPIYEGLGLTVGVLQNNQPYEEKRAAYAADITYGTNSEFGFDYLRDNMATTPGGEGPARRPHRRGRQAGRDAQLRDRRRGRQHPHRRGAHAADHLRRARAGRGPLRALRQARAEPDRPGKKPEGMDPRAKKEFTADYDYEFDEKHKTVSVTEQGVEKAETLPRHRPPLPRRERPAGQPPQPGAEGRVALQEGRRLRRHRRRGQDHRRVHRPDPGRPALVGGPAPGRRGQGGRARPRGEPDARDDHAAELLPHVRQARGHVGHGPDRGHRVHEDLQGRRRGDPHEPADGPHGQERPDLQDPRGQVAGGRARDPGAPRQGPARARRHDLGRGLRAALRAPAQDGRPAHGAQRQARARRARGRDHRRGRLARRGHDRDQHGRPRRRHQARRQRRAPHGARAHQARPAPGRPGLRGALRRHPAEDRGARRGRPRRPSSRPAACSSAAPSATSRAGSTTSCAAAPAARATRASRASSSPPRTTSCACSPATGSTRSWTASARRATTARRSRSRRRCSRSRSRAPSARSRSRTTSSASASSSTTTS